ncbi:EhaF family protein [Methanobrevibacter sp.]|uniref:EhaF family protein n=1 Tax=Methanobrevibacter sp. TaxID=66852 RepID=UPI00388D0F99|nr:EhaF family protein [Methanobrevibacter sp.]MBR0059412.1 EhaF family protein [Methanobrevibacter sp.]MBR0370103.1 EhaF family protein [Methanobrevibacter sp.]
MKIGRIWNKLADPKNVPRLFAFCLGIILIVGFVVPMALNPDQLYTRPAPQEQIDEGLPIAPYDRGGVILKEPGIIHAQYPENSKELGMITAYMSPLAEWVSSISPYFGTSIYSSPGGLIDEVLYYTRGFDTILESSILMMAFIIASWLTVNYTMNRRDIEKDLKKAANDSANLAREVKINDEKARAKQLRRDN